LRSCLSDAVQHGGLERLAGRLAAPEDELERREEPLAFGDRDVHHVLQALGRGARRAAQQDGVAEDRHPVLAVHAEMADPQALVGLGEQLVQHRAAPLRHLQVEGAGEVHGADLARPAEIQAVIAPFARRLDGHLGVVAAVELPVVGGDDLLHDVEGVAGGAVRAVGDAQ
jgi:hypothetical protein